MKVFRVKADIDKYQLILPVSDSDAVYNMLDFDGRSKANSWESIEFYVDNPKEKEGNFFGLIGSSALICDQKTADTLTQVFYLGCELLPIHLNDRRQLYIVNVIDCVNVLDESRAKFDVYDDGTRGRILDYAFHRNRFHESSLFKIPQTVRAEVLTYSGVKSPEDEFYTAYMGSGLEGLAFELLYAE
jgi:hypothetical protein